MFFWGEKCSHFLARQRWQRGWNPCIPEAGATINHCLFLSDNHGPVWKNGAAQLELLISGSSCRGPLGSVEKVVLALQSGLGSSWRTVVKTKPDSLLTACVQGLMRPTWSPPQRLWWEGQSIHLLVSEAIGVFQAWVYLRQS